MDNLEKIEFEELKKIYNNVNDKFEKTLIFHVGTCAGFYSELGSMLECMMYCYYYRIKFVLYADDANFTSGIGGGGYSEFFEPFCEENHYWLNRYANRRYKRNHFYSKLIDLILRTYLKKRTKCTYLTVDKFEEFISREFKNIVIVWPEMGINGKVCREYVKLMPLAMRYNEKTRKEVIHLIDDLKLPDKYMSVQIRGGDKIQEYKTLINVEDLFYTISLNNIDIQDLFVFTDDYENVNIIKAKHPEWRIYTLTKRSECGYDNTKFQHFDWENKRMNLIKLFAMVEVCIGSDLHFGCEQACVNNIIKAAKTTNSYIPLQQATGLVKPK